MALPLLFKPTNTLRGKLVHVKDKQPRDKQSNLVYGIKCDAANCSETYIGETCQALKARANQHRKPCSNEAQNSAVYIHLKDTGHAFKTEDVVILDREERYRERGIKEAIWERVENPSLNKKGGLRFQLSNAWDQALRDVPSRLVT